MCLDINTVLKIYLIGLLWIKSRVGSDFVVLNTIFGTLYKENNTKFPVQN